jgi:hypothetical protein
VIGGPQLLVAAVADLYVGIDAGRSLIVFGRVREDSGCSRSGAPWPVGGGSRGP